MNPSNPRDISPKFTAIWPGLRKPWLALALLLTALASARAETPRINGPSVFGVRPGSDFQYKIPATGTKPIQYSVAELPAGLRVDPANGLITGSLQSTGTHAVVLQAANTDGTAVKKFKIVCGDQICLTPPMGWNSWNCWAAAVDQEKVMRSAQALVKSGLIDHGWTYVNIDDTWQGRRGGPFKAIQGNQKFPDMKDLCAKIHALGLKAGIYSTPWITSYAKHIGGSSDNSDGSWNEEMACELYWKSGRHSFATNDARQWAEWGFDYLKYDWNPNDLAHVREMSGALRATRRDIVFSLSNSGPFPYASELAKYANCWRTTGDIWDYWDHNDNEWRYGVSEIGFAQDAWAPYAGPGHWNDPDMLVVGRVGWGPEMHPSKLTPDEQYSHFSLWCLLSAPLLIGCDLEQMDDFTLRLLSNDEVLAIDQDALGKQATRVATMGAVDIYKKELEDGGWALGFFNRANESTKVTFNKLARIGIPNKVNVRDLWRQQDLPAAEGELTVSVNPHGVTLLKLTPAEVSGARYDWTQTLAPERPYIHAYHKTMVTKLFLAWPEANEGCHVLQTFEQALESIKKLDRLTLGVPKIVYLVGWQHNGHDSKYPDWSVVNPRLKRAQDATAADSLKWLMAEGFKHHTTVSLHINMFDIYENSPLWETYLTNNIIAKDEKGNVLPGEGSIHYISYAREWETGFAQKRIDGLMAMLPIQQAGTIHVDAYHSARPIPHNYPQKDNPQLPKTDARISPYLDYSLEKEVAAQRKVFRYWRDHGVDMTCEGSGFLRPDAFIGLQPMAWWYDEIPGVPPQLYCGSPLHAEEEFKSNPDDLTVLIEQLCLKFVPWYYRNNASGTASESDFTATKEAVYMPVGWLPRTLVAFSKNESSAQTHLLPPDWRGVKTVAISELTLEGPKFLEKLPVRNETITLHLSAGRGVLITPAAD